MKIIGNMDIRDNQLYVGGFKAENLVEDYGTPLNVMDENLIRNNCNRYTKSFVGNTDNRVAYAGKAFLTLYMCKIIKECGMYLDVVSGGELYTAQKSGFPMERIYFHGNNKTSDEVNMGVKLGVGTFVVDNYYEMELIEKYAKAHEKIQRVILRVTPGIEAHTHEYIKTGQIDSKFGFTKLNHGIIKAVKKVAKYPHIDFQGIHCHIGSQIFETKPYEEAVKVMFNIASEIKEMLNIEIKEIDLGGGFGIYYKDGDKPKKIEEFTKIIREKAENMKKEYNINIPILTIEPGRSIVGNSGITLYTIGAIKDIPQVRKYVAVDGGMGENIRPALYDAEYESIVANNVNSEDEECITIAGKCCESGDILIKDITLPKIKSGDIIAIMNTGAYGYSMASNYNKIPKPAVVMVSNGTAKLICKRQTYADLIKNEMIY
ncbi:diaminopimelate decarboxylase [Hathewaya proteolytica DSM 3090]|uniref:Diaminopimelate decarboxylase n=1 Tax=Hathewaya proteolytica DSM 3090 TaxID=1121331 RepID=A0A1M6QMG9_9CLOT|nr:diaminopimelate decarboxylase [Hathewaya proteolytica]SHK21452.1 diaminopimelate decarboxylase [Hathewaya proteolytica DSM 3090]